ncbi:MAG: tryptophan--tRNA ligase [Methanocalculus sp. MSAO_Arc2]|uniref:tryptophan--tRNA ligase n=1 Tax=Methanocalculus sp. MSAO_Arc2 TaxID=2293855 RepID=UPI000FF0390A|nr:MAG: tryptophan--tRNA ligase [Methanocalculus sp. MSAO_Arc2]
MESGINPWSNTESVDVGRLFAEFGIAPVEKVTDTLVDLPAFFRRKIVVGHRDYGSIVDAINSRSRFNVMTGFMPSGHPHLGHLMVMREVVWHVEQGGSGYVAIADREAHAVRGLSWDACRKYGREYLECLYALGFSGTTYFQSRNDRIKDLAFEAAIRINFADLSSIYGFSPETSLAHADSVATQVADILYPQVDSGPAPTVVPVGIDQDPHIRLTRDVAHKMRWFTVLDRGDIISVRSKNAPVHAMDAVAEAFPGSKRYEGHVDIPGADCLNVSEKVRLIEVSLGGYGFITPSSTYHTFMEGLQGGKMSSSIEDSLFWFDDPLPEVKRKVMAALTGGRMTKEEQVRLGGEPDRCPVYLLNLFHMIEDDGELQEIRSACLSGSLLCGACKKETFERVKEFLSDFREQRAAVSHKVVV